MIVAINFNGLVIWHAFQVWEENAVSSKVRFQDIVFRSTSILSNCHHKNHFGVNSDFFNLEIASAVKLHPVVFVNCAIVCIRLRVP